MVLLVFSFYGKIIMNETIIHFWENIATTSLGIIITMVGFWVTVGKNMVTRSEVLTMIETQSPYNNDRQFIMERLAINKETQAALTGMLQRNTEVMNELKVQLATLGKTLEALEEQNQILYGKLKTVIAINLIRKLVDMNDKPNRVHKT